MIDLKKNDSIYFFLKCSILFACLLCVLRFVGHSEWFRADHKGKFNWDFLNYKDTPLEEVDMSYTIINYTGLSNLGTSIYMSFPNCSFGHFHVI